MESLIKKTVIVSCQDIESRGSGFVVDKNGLIATNHHVISDNNGNVSNNIRVIFDNGDEFPAQIINAKQEYDLAILRIKKDDLKYLEVGSFNKIQEFSQVYFLGQGLDVPKISLHMGWISRKVQVGQLNAIQIDGPINQGNSGGPVINKAGKVIAIITRTEAVFDQDLLFLLKLIPTFSGKIEFFGINLAETLRRIIYFLNRNRFVGIGYALSIEYLDRELETIR